MSRKKNPWGKLGVMSPDRPEMANAEPSTKVTVPTVPSIGTSPAYVHGSAIASGTLTAQVRGHSGFSPTSVVLLDSERHDRHP